MEIHGPVDLSLLERAVSRAVQDTDAFRVRFELDEDGPWQVLDAVAEWDMPVVDLRDSADPEAAARSWMDADLHATVDPTAPPLFSFAVLRLTSGRSALYAGVHHLLLDGFGFSLFLQRIAEVYTALERDEQVPETAMGSLRDLVEDEVGYRESEQFWKDRDYWMRQLADMPEIVSPSGRGTPGAKGFVRETGQVPAPVVNRLRSLARRCRSSLPTVAMAALALYVHRETDAEDMLLELVVTGRQGATARNTPGMLTNAPPLRVQVSSELSVGELVRHAATRARGVLQHQRYPSMFLPWDLGLVETGDVPEPPAMNIMGYDRTLQFGQHPVTLHNVSNGSVENLTVNVYERADDGSLRIDFNANPAFYGEDDNAAHHRNFLNLLHALAEAEPEQLVTHVAPRTPAIAR